MLLDFKKLLGDAQERLSHADDPRRIILIHTGAILLVALLLSIADHLLSQQIGGTGGLRGMSGRAILETVQSILRLAQTFVLPFWQIGYLFYSLQIAKGERGSLNDLTEGFRRFFPVLRLHLILTGIGIGLALLCSYVSAFLFLMSPWSAPLMESIESMALENLTEEAMMNAVMAMSQQMLLPIILIFSVCFLAAGFFLFFRFRLAEIWLMDHPQGGALMALRHSRKAMKGNFKAMLKIDLHFWWFYLLEFLIGLLGIGDMILDTLGIEMSTDTFLTYLLFFALYLICQLALYGWKKNEVAVTYANAYLTLCPPETEAETQ